MAHQIIRIKRRSVEDLQRRLERKGWDYGDDGAFGFVMLKGNLAWKIERYDGYNGEYSSEKPGNGVVNAYSQFVTAYGKGTIKRTKALPHMRLQFLFKDGSATLMERLKVVLDNAEIADEKGLLDNSGLSAVIAGHSYVTIYNRDTGSYETLSGETLARYQARVPTLVTNTVETLKAWSKSLVKSVCFDLHGQNVMLRNNGEIVIIDPFS